MIRTSGIKTCGHYESSPAKGYHFHTSSSEKKAPYIFEIYYREDNTITLWYGEMIEHARNCHNMEMYRC